MRVKYYRSLSHLVACISRAVSMRVTTDAQTPGQNIVGLALTTKNQQRWGLPRATMGKLVSSISTSTSGGHNETKSFVLRFRSVSASCEIGLRWVRCVVGNCNSAGHVYL
jgi:hypothetical protein